MARIQIVAPKFNNSTWETTYHIDYITHETPHTPPQQQDLDLLLLGSSPRDGTERCKASAIFNSAIKASHDIPSPAKRFSERMTRSLETTHSELSTLRKQVEQQRSC